MPEVLSIAAGLVFLALFAFFIFGWWQDRRDRRDYIATLSERDRLRLQGFEEGDTWRRFRELEGSIQREGELTSKVGVPNWLDPLARSRTR